MMKNQKIFSIILFSAIFLANYSPSSALKEFGLEECEKSRACWAYPPDCDSAQNCHGIMRWRFKENKLLVELEAKPIGEAGDAQWMAMGFSDDLQMGNDSILECIFNTGGNGTSNAAFISYNYFTQNIQLRDASKKMIMDKEFFQSDGKLGCNFTINYNNADEPIADEKKLIFKLDGRRQWWHILFAQGPVDRKSATKQFHLLVQKSDQLVHICQNCTDKFVRIEK